MPEKKTDFEKALQQSVHRLYSKDQFIVLVCVIYQIIYHRPITKVELDKYCRDFGF